MDPNLIVATTIQEISLPLLGIDETAYYYTFSTISQTLAGAFGILGAFVLFRLQGINKSCQKMCELILNKKHPGESHLSSLELAYLHQDWISFGSALVEVEKNKLVFKNYIVNKAEVDSCFKYLYRLAIRRKKIIKYLKDTLFLTVIAIVLSLACLPFSKIINQSKLLLLSVPIAVILSIICVFRYKELVSKALKEPHKEQPKDIKQKGD